MFNLHHRRLHHPYHQSIRVQILQKRFLHQLNHHPYRKTLDVMQSVLDLLDESSYTLGQPIQAVVQV